MVWYQDKVIRCHAQSKRTGENCKAPATKHSGYKVCHKHGGAPGSGRPPSTFRYVNKENIFALIRESKKNPALLDIKEDVAVMDAMLKSYLGKVVDENLTSKVINQAVAIAEKRSQAVLRYFQAQKERAETFNLVQIGLIISYLAEVVRKHITDAEERKKIAQELEEIPYDRMIE